MIINENGWGDKPQEAKESLLAKKLKKQAEKTPAEAEGDDNAEQE